MRLLECFQKILRFFFDPEKVKKRASKVAHNQPRPFYFTVQPRPTAHSPELTFHIMKSRDQTSVLLSVIQTNLLLWKICHLQLNYSEEVCSNLTLSENESIEIEVQAKANSFLMIQEYLMYSLAFIWCLFYGKLC